MSLSRRHLALIPVALALWPTGPLAAQVSWSGRLGATWTSPMVTDELGTTVELKPGLAPTLGIEMRFPLKTKTPLEGSLEVQGTIASLYREESGNKTDLLSMRTLSFTGGVTGRLTGPMFLRAGVGFVSYLTTEQESVFQDGTPIRLLGTAALEYRGTMGSGYHVTGLLRYDLHGFTTDQLESSGYTGSQTVHRIMLGVGIGK